MPTHNSREVLDITNKILALIPHIDGFNHSSINHKVDEIIHQELQKARTESYEQGYTQGKFDEKMDAEYKHQEELQKAREEERERIANILLADENKVVQTVGKALKSIIRRRDV